MKKKESEITRKETSIDFRPKNREEMIPCKDCRKRDSCFISPKQNKCTGYETGTPWSLIMLAMNTDDYKYL